MATWVFLNDAFIKEENARLHYRDLSIQRGYGIFDFFKFIDRRPVFLEDHLDRFYYSAKEMRLEPVISRATLRTIIEQLIQKNEEPVGGIRLTLTGGYSADGYQLSHPNLLITQHSFIKPADEQFKRGLHLITQQHQRQIPHVKTTDYLMAIWLQPLLREKNADDFLYHNNDVISECPRANFFIVTKDETIVTPGKNILRGVSRLKIIEAAKDHFPVEERQLTISELRNATEAFISSTTKLILPVTRVDDQLLEGPKPVTAKLFALLSELQSSDAEMAKH